MKVHIVNKSPKPETLNWTRAAIYGTHCTLYIVESALSYFVPSPSKCTISWGLDLVNVLTNIVPSPSKCTMELTSETGT